MAGKIVDKTRTRYLCARFAHYETNPTQKLNNGKMVKRDLLKQRAFSGATFFTCVSIERKMLIFFISQAQIFDIFGKFIANDK